MTTTGKENSGLYTPSAFQDWSNIGTIFGSNIGD